jgi:hypothetical protein
MSSNDISIRLIEYVESMRSEDSRVWDVDKMFELLYQIEAIKSWGD